MSERVEKEGVLAAMSWKREQELERVGIDEPDVSVV